QFVLGVPPFFTYLSNHVNFSQSTCSIVSLPRYPWASNGRKTSRTVPPLPRIASYMRADWIGNVPSLSSAAPWINRTGVLILFAYIKGDILRYTSGASHNVRRSVWKPNGVNVRLWAPGETERTISDRASEYWGCV